MSKHLEENMQTILGLLELLAATISPLIGQENNRGLVEFVLQRLELRAEQLRTSEPQISKLILVSALGHRDDMCFEKGDYEGALRSSREGMSVADKNEAAYYNFMSGAARAHFKLGQIEEGYSVLGKGYRCAIEHGVDELEIPSNLRLPRYADYGRAKKVDVYYKTLREFAETRRGITGEEFDRLWDRDPEALMERLRAQS